MPDSLRQFREDSALTSLCHVLNSPFCQITSREADLQIAKGDGIAVVAPSPRGAVGFLLGSRDFQRLGFLRHADRHLPVGVAQQIGYLKRTLVYGKRKVPHFNHAREEGVGVGDVVEELFVLVGPRLEAVHPDFGEDFLRRQATRVGYGMPAAKGQSGWRWRPDSL